MKTEKLGKKIVITIIIVLLLINVMNIISIVVIRQDSGMAFFGLVRLAFIGSILYFFYAGNKTAKWLLVIITLLNGIPGFLASLLRFRALIGIDIMNMALEFICIAIGVILIVSSPVNNFLSFQLEENKKESNDYESES